MGAKQGLEEWTVLDVFEVSGCFFSIFSGHAISSMPKRAVGVRGFFDTKLVLLRKSENFVVITFDSPDR